MSDAAFDNQNAAAGGGRPGMSGGGEPLDDMIGAYLLDALSEEERTAFEAFLLDSEATQQEVSQLRPVVDLLPLALELPVTDPMATRVAPSAGLRDRILAAAQAESAASDVTAQSIAPPTAPAAAPAPSLAPPSPPPPTPVRPVRPEPTPLRPPGRILPASRPGGGERWGGIAAFGWSRLAAAILALIAAVAVIWAISLQGRISDLENERKDLQGTITAGQGNQTLAYILQSTADGPANAAGVLVPGESGDIAYLDLVGMSPLPEGQVYQLWFVDLDANGEVAAPPTPSVTLGIDDQGRGTVIDVPLPSTEFDAVALTVEPAGGSSQPTTAIQMFGTAGTAFG